MCQKTSSTPSVPAGYPPTYRLFSPVSRSAAWTLQPAVRTASHRSQPRRRLLVLVHPPNNTALLQEIEDLSHQVATLSAEQDHLRTSFRDPPLSSRDPCSSTRDPRPAPGIADQTADPPPEATPYLPSAGTIAVLEPKCKSVRHPASTASRGNQCSRHHLRHMFALRQTASL
jgi:hypothetical protein